MKEMNENAQGHAPAGSETPKPETHQSDPATPETTAQSGLCAPPCCAAAEPSRDQTLFDRKGDPVEDDFEIPFDLLCDNPSPYFDARLSTIGALFITYDPNWNDKLFGWMEDAEKRGKLINKNGSVTCHPFLLSS